MRLLLSVCMALVLAIWGVALDVSEFLKQGWLFAAIQVASLAGTLLGYVFQIGRIGTTARRVALFFAIFVSWRLAYFPVMVFAGHLASINEWILAATGLPIVIFPTFLISVMVLHAVATTAISLIVRPRWRFGLLFSVFVFVLASAISFTGAEDFHLLPDDGLQTTEDLPEPRAAVENPYRTARFNPSYTLNQRLMLLAAGLTYETIPSSPWGETVKATLEGLFRENPHESTSGRIREHYIAYHVAHAFIGCRKFEDCPLSENGRKRDAKTNKDAT